MKSSLKIVIVPAMAVLIAWPGAGFGQSNPAGQKRYTDREEIIFEDGKYSRGSAPVQENNRDEVVRKETPERDSKREESTDESRTPSSEKFYQTGLASWYGREFHGKVTASGEKFNMNELTAAHKNLPFGTVLVVKNLDNGKSVRVRINDRGPYRGSRIIDLSYDAAKELDMLQKGEALVGISILGAVDKPSRDSGNGNDSNELNRQEVEPVVDGGRDRQEKDKSQESGSKEQYVKGFGVQTGAFYSRKNAEKQTKMLENMFHENVVIIKDGDLYKVQMKGIRDKARAVKYSRELRKKGIAPIIME